MFLETTLAPPSTKPGPDLVGKYARFLGAAQAFAAMSKYPRTRVGALILGAGYEVLASGWNGAPRGCEADVDYRSRDRDELLTWISHAEANAIANAARVGTPVGGATIVVTHSPCMHCALLIVQSGIKRVISPKPDDAFFLRWGKDLIKARSLFRECSVENFEIDTTGI